MSMYSSLMKDATIGSANTSRICDFDETDPYYFVVREKGQILAEGELTVIKMKLDEAYLYKRIKNFSRDRSIMVAMIDF